MASPQRIMIVAWGSRGDIQPVTALALGLTAVGREVLVFATPPATDLIQDNGIDCIAAEENVADFVEDLFGQLDLSDRSVRGQLKLAQTAKKYQNSPGYLAAQESDMRRALAAAREFQPDLLVTPNIIYGPFMSMAEALHIPVVTYDLQINYPTSEYPLFTMELGKVPQAFNRTLYLMKALLYPRTVRSRFDQMREICGLPIDTYANGTKIKVWPHDLPQICAVSPSLCPQPADWPPQKIVSGWWFLPGGVTDYTPPPGLVEFLEHRPVYVGFGSMKGNPEFCTALSTLAIRSLQLAGVKGVLLGGWAGLTRDALDTSTDEGQDLHDWAAENVFEIESCPHDWLFPQCAAVVHHGGAGTLAAGIRAGKPTIVCATQGDQPFHGSIAQARGVGQYLGMVGSPRLTPETVAAGITEVTTDPAMLAAAQAMGEQVRAENGVGTAIDFMDRAVVSFRYPWPTAG